MGTLGSNRGVSKIVHLRTQNHWAQSRVVMLRRFINKRRDAKPAAPEQCCTWCETEAKNVDEKLHSLEHRLAEAEKKLAIDRTMELVRIRLDTASHMFGQVMLLLTERRLETTDVDAISSAILSAAERSIEQALLSQPAHKLASAPRSFPSSI